MSEYIVLKFVLDSLPPKTIMVLPATQFLTEKWPFMEEGEEQYNHGTVIYRAQRGLRGSAVPTQFSSKELSGINQWI